MESDQKLASPNPTNEQSTETVLRTENLDIYYGSFLAVKGVNLDIPKNKITAFIGPSGCGKSTLIRCFNRLNDLIDLFILTEKLHLLTE